MNTITSIAVGAFRGCTGITEVSFPAATFIGLAAFSDCTGLNKVTLGTITESNFHTNALFPGNLRTVYLGTGGGEGTYKRELGSDDWTKQP